MKKKWSISITILMIIIFIEPIISGSEGKEDIIGIEEELITDTFLPLWPQIHHSKIVWEDCRNGNSQIYLFNLENNSEIRLSYDETSVWFPDIWEDNVVWSSIEVWQEKGHISVHNLKTNETTQITEGKRYGIRPRIFKDSVVWMEGSSPEFNIIYYNLKQKRFETICDDPGYQGYPEIFSNHIVWKDNSNKGQNIVLYDLNLKRTQWLTNDSLNRSMPKIFDKFVCWNEYNENRTNILVYDIEHQEMVLNITELGDIGETSIFGDRLLFTHYNKEKEFSLILYNMTSNRQYDIVLDTLSTNEREFDIWEDNIIWIDYRDIENGGKKLFKLFLDRDLDGTGDSKDPFPDDKSEWSDTDLDGVGDNTDLFPFDNNEWNDTDRDGVGDNSDPFPADPFEWLDSDNDGKGDNSDSFPFDPSASIDSDGDGYPDEWNPEKDASDSNENLRLDKYPDDPDKWEDEREKNDYFWVYILISTIFILIFCILFGIIIYVNVKKRKSE